MTHNANILLNVSPLSFENWNVAVVVAVIFVVAYLLAFAYLNNRANKHRKKVQANLRDKVLSDKNFSYPVACAGSRDVCGVPTAQGIDVNEVQLADADGKAINPRDYSKFVVHGDSMKYAGISDGDLIFVKRGFKPDDLTDFPQIIVLRYRCAEPEKPNYKVRRAWAKGTVDSDFESIAESVFDNPKFQNLERQQGFMGKDWMLQNLREERLPKFHTDYPNATGGIVLSTTFDTATNQIHFSLHPATSVVGIVSQAFAV